MSTSAAGMPCPTCQGHGAINTQNGVQKCPMCEGSGQAFDPGLFFVYEMGPLALTANQVTTNNSVQILDRSFRLMMMTAISTGPFAIQILDSRNKRPFSNQLVHSSNLFGTGQNPFPLLTPFVFERRGSILANITDLSGANNSIRIDFIGVELNDGPGQ